MAGNKFTFSVIAERAEPQCLAGEKKRKKEKKKDN
jgi:hypothetical protein